MRTAIENTQFDNVERVTASFGVAFFTQSDDQESLVKRADDALYKAKKFGRNKVEIIE